MLLSLVLGTLQFIGIERYLLWLAASLYLLGVQGPTILFNIPLNNAVQALDIALMSDQEVTEARAKFEEPWNRWNRFRTVTGILCVAVLLLLQVLR